MERIFNQLIVVFFALGFFCTACTQHKVVEQKQESLTEKVFVVNIVNDEQKLKEYLDHHQQVWPEVEAGFTKAGYRKITLYRYGHLLVMTILVPEHADLDAMGKLAESYNPRCAAWNRLMNQYQAGVEGTKPGQTWVEATPFYTFSNGNDHSSK